jgi:flagellin-like protein
MVATKFKQMLQDEGAVSPVIGVILMVAVTVVLGAVIGAFVFGIGDKLGEPAPNAQLNFDYDADGNSLDIVHDGGDSITPDNTGSLAVSGSNIASDGSDLTWAPSGSTASNNNNGYVLGSGVSLTSGDDIVTVASVDSGHTVDLQWVSNGGDQSTTLGEFEAP